jgi:hypothetical protein
MPASMSYGPAAPTLPVCINLGLRRRPPEASRPQNGLGGWLRPAHRRAAGWGTDAEGATASRDGGVHRPGRAVVVVGGFTADTVQGHRPRDEAPVGRAGASGLGPGVGAALGPGGLRHRAGDGWRNGCAGSASSRRAYHPLGIASRVSGRRSSSSTASTCQSSISSRSPVGSERSCVGHRGTRSCGHPRPGRWRSRRSQL